MKKYFIQKKFKKKDFLKKGKFPIISQEENYINGYWDNEIDVFRIKNQPIVIFGDHTRVIKYIDFDFILGADGFVIVSDKTAFIDLSIWVSNHAHVLTPNRS